MDIARENGTLNYSFVRTNVMSTYNPAVIVIFICISILIFTINTLVLLLYYYKSSLLKKPSNRLLLSLSICDLANTIGLILITINIMVPDEFSITYRILVDIYEAFLVKTIVFHLCGLTLDRYIALFFALRYQAIVTCENVKQYIIISWIVPFITSTIQLSWLHKVISGKVSTDDEFKIRMIDFWFSSITFLIFLALPMVLLAAAFGTMISEIQRIALSTPGRNIGVGKRGSALSLSEKRSTYIYGVMFLTFLLLTMPYYSLRLKNDIELYFTDSHTAWYDVLLSRIVVACKYSTSIIRPAIYAVASLKLKIVLSELWKKLLYGKICPDDMAALSR